MRAYRTQVEQAGGRENGRRAEAPTTFAQRVLALQRAAGNAVVARAVEEELHEHGAACGHETAEQPPAGTSSVQRSSVVDAVRSPGRPLDSRLMEKAEQGYGMSFRHVRVHSDPVAQRSATELGARAYTTGHDIVVGPQGADDETMFHELDHVRQQSLGPVAGTDNGSGVAVSHQDDPFERHATANGRRMAQGAMPDLSGPGSGASAGTATPAQDNGGGITVARMMAGGGRRMHRRDRGQMFEITGERGPIVGRYVKSSDGMEIFDTTQGRIEVHPTQIMGPRATVGGLHPQGRTRPPEENLHDRDQILLSEADLSGVRARVRRDPSQAGRMAATTYEERPDYQEYENNREDLRRLGVPVLNDVDLSRPEAAGRLSGVGPNANMHFQMPRVPRGTPGYSTQELIRDTGRLPARAGRDDVTVSVTTPHPSRYGKPGTHNGFYGMENRKAVPEGMRFAGEQSDDDAYLEEYGYGHRQSTKDVGAAVADRRKTYRMEPDRRSNSPEEDPDPAYRSRSKSRSRTSQAPPRPARRHRSRPPLSTTGRRPPAPEPVNYAAVEDEDEYFGSQQPETSSRRHRRGSVAPSYLDDSADERTSRRRSRRPVDVEAFEPEPERERSRSRRRRSSRAPSGMTSSRPVDLGDAVSYGAGPIDDEPRRERSRSRRRRSSRAPSGTSSSYPVDLGDAVSYGSGPIDDEPRRQRGRSRRPSSSRAPFITDSGRSTRAPVSYAEPEWDEGFQDNPFAPEPRRERGRR
ncbi:DUF4157 domain-containing protein [Streptomyces atroolivaceus]|uniref:DUF4157 domain-containing protein n=1 Tax=Streptomyces atroolivaceus TaxID=66869 RepID=A0ABV9V2H5_STRAZ|nr:DUF4157 domain-containing protein [Streptomyces atroolivaceus]